ncbi:MAG: adenosylcobalamin-dependent ribonucleoside-diphosphate reductase [Nitrospira sp.]
MSQGPTLPISEETHAAKYRAPGETYRDSVSRVANALKDDQPHYKKFREVMMDMRFWPAGRVLSAMGATKTVTPYNCFVSGTIEDSFVEGAGSIMERAGEAAATMRVGGGIGYDFSTLRPRGDMIRKLASQATGPISFMEIYDAVCRCVCSSGHRRGAQMGVLRIDHPDIEEFIHAKHNQSSLTGFNISVAVTDKFMHCLSTGKPFPLEFGGRVYREVDPHALWDKLMRSTWDWAEPGVLFIDTINRMNNLWYCETIAATNPCGEQPLPPFGACLLGSFNVVKYLQSDGVIDFAQLRKDIPHVVRAMDNVVDRAEYPLPEQGREARAKRRMGLGVMGLANALEAQGLAYGTPEFANMQERVHQVIRDECYAASIQLATEKGDFAKLDRQKYCDGEFIQTLPKELIKDISKFGIRNSHLTSIAPTGTISLCADNVSSGIEPVFAYSYDRTVIEAQGPRTETIEDYGVRVLGVKGKRTCDVTIEEHLRVLTTAARNVDSAVSKTCNVPGDVPWEAFKEVYVQAYNGGAKGCTTFRTDGKRAGILVAKDTETPDEEGTSCQIDPMTGRRSCE